MPDLNRTWHLLPALVAVLAGGCGANRTTSESGQGGAAGSGNDGGSSNGGDNGGVGGFGGPGGHGQGGAGGAACAGATVKGERIPLDIYLMLDKSGSMADKTGANGDGPSKWTAVTTALDAFFAEAGPSGLSVGMQFFPTTAPGVPGSCTTSAQCGVGGPCLLNACQGDLQTGSLTPCVNDGDCGFFDTCVPLGQCSQDTGYVCEYGAGGCGSLGSCDPITQSFCMHADSCSGADYAHPAVEIAPLSGGAAALKAAIVAIQPRGATPTAPALQGAIEHAREWASAHPQHKVVAVLATDGLPTECSPVDIASIAGLAAAGKSGSPSVLTFVIGVFGQSDAGAHQNLDAIAQKGGTGSAFFITDDEDVSAAFLAALQAIQGETLACEYQLPTPPEGSELDYAKVNVMYTAAGAAAAATVPYVAKQLACDGTGGGWYYDKDPAAGETPTKLLMCPATCAELAGMGGQVNIEIGCQTVVPEPK